MDYHSEGKEFSQDHYNEKLEKLSKAEQRGDLDVVLKPVLERLLRLPFSTHDTCSGHTKSGAPDQLTDFPALFIADEEGGSEKIQERFRGELPLLEKNINERLGGDIVKIKLVPYLVELENGESKWLTLEETIKMGLTYGVKFEISDPAKAETEGRHILTIVWEEFYKYLGRFDGRELALPVFDEQAFIRRRKIKVRD